jgi:starch-binding outer membrane protein, SusD/RagB family
MKPSGIMNMTTGFLQNKLMKSSIIALFQSKIKSLTIIVLTAISMVVVSCNDIIHEEEDEPVHIDSDEKMLNALTGVYDRFKIIFFSSDYSNNLYQTPNSNGDDYNHSNMNQMLFKLVNNEWQIVQNNEVRVNEWSSVYNNKTEPWDLIYKTIVSINNIIIQINPNSVSGASMKNMLGEAYLLRAYCYFRLVRIYGELPIIDNTQVNYDIKKSSVEEIYNFIEADLNKATVLLPENASASRIPHITPHQGTVKAILAEVYLTRAGYPLKQTEYYTKAVEMAGNVIDNTQHYGFALLPDFAALWDGSSTNNESEFMLSLLSNGSSYGYSYGSLGNDTTIIAPFLRLDGVYAPGIKFYNNFPDSYRKKMTFNDVFLKPTIMLKYGINEYVYFRKNSMDFSTPVQYRKFQTKANALPGLKINFDTIGFTTFFYTPKYYKMYIYRYAQTLLTYAEAKARAGQLDASAYEAVNMVRRRANRVDIVSPSVYDITPGLTSEQFADSVVWERAWELCAEAEGRWFDLMRLEMVEKLSQLRDAKDMLNMPKVFDKSFYYRPIPDYEKNLNPNLESTNEQNLN